MTSPTKRCPRCEERKPWEDFHVKVRWPDGTTRQPHTYCKPCHNEYSREGARRRWHEDPEWARSRMLRHTKAHLDPERYAARLAYRREWTRQKRGTLPENYGAPKTGTESLTIPCEPIREAIEMCGLGPSMIAERAGLDEACVRRMFKQATTSPERASLILDACGILPSQVGL